MYGIKGEFRQFCFDRAVMTFGGALEAELDAVEGKNKQAIERKRARILDKWLDRPLKFREPMLPTGPTASGSNDIEQSFSIPGGM
jgi:hypothetical protein